MYRTSRKNGICFKSLEETLARNPKAYRHIDLISFGFPCQDISQANSKGKGLKGERSSIFFECMRVVDIFKPTWLLIENVPRLLSINQGQDMATVLQTLAKSGYGWSYRLLDSQYFGVAQRRRRVFIVGCLGKIPPPEILFEQKSRSRDDKKKQKMGQRGLCISTKDGERQDPTSATFVAQTVRGQDCPQVGNRGAVKHNFVAQTIGATPRGNTSFIWQDTHIAEINPRRKRTTTRFPKGLDSRRGIAIGNAVTVNVAEWIGERIIRYSHNHSLI